MLTALDSFVGKITQLSECIAWLWPSSAPDASLALGLEPTADIFVLSRGLVRNKPDGLKYLFFYSARPRVSESADELFMVRTFFPRCITRRDISDYEHLWGECLVNSLWDRRPFSYGTVFLDRTDAYVSIRFG